MKNTTIIIPILPLNTEEELAMFKECIGSIPTNYPVIVVGNEEAMNSIDKVKLPSQTEKLVNEGETKLPHQINLAVGSVKTEYFTVLEFDDKFTKNWFRNFDQYSKTIKEDIAAYLPLTEVLDYKTKGIIGYANEAFWASSFSEEIGYMDISSLQDYLNINAHGGIFNTEIFKSYGMLKSSMPILYWYEFLLRALYKGKKVYVIPKVGYIHTVERPGCASETIEMNQHEFEWWLDLANKEYFFTQDRNKTYKGA